MNYNVQNCFTGGDIDVEQQMIRRLPPCVMIGVDPFDYAKTFNQIGKFHHVAIGGRSGTYKAHVATHSETANQWGFEWLTVGYLSLERFMQKFMNDTRLVDILLLDAEGAEHQRLC